jgi:integrase/recombinase XerD
MDVEEVAQFEERHPIGTKARLALAIILYTAGRREDAVRLGPQHVCEVTATEKRPAHKRLRFRQGKNEDRAPVDIDIPLHPTLARIIDATPSGHLTFLVTEHGKPFTANGFGNKFKDWCREANLPHCSAHGVRKATSARLAEEGASPHEIMAITGHQTLDEVVRYTATRNVPGMADKAMARLK